MKKTDTILIVDDQDDIRLLISGILEDNGYRTSEVADSQSAEALIAKEKPSLVVLDIWLENSELDGLQLMKKLAKTYPDLPVIIISGHGTIETAVKAIQLGAYDFLEKPFKSDKLLVMVQRALESAQLRAENKELKVRVGRAVSELHGKSSHILQVKAAIERVAAANSRVLITGEPGVGKDVAARMIHAHSRRADKNYVSVNCAVLSADRIDLELFGMEENGQRTHEGMLEKANGGTLFLDEVADMPPETQARIVRVLQDQHFTRIGGTQPIDVDIRFIASSNQNLPEMMTQGQFRQDLYYRLNVVPIEMQPLRMRLEDIPLLAEMFMDATARTANVPSRGFAADAMALMQAYEWPGNVRQLRNVIEWLLIMAPGEASAPITADMLPPDLKQKASEMIRGGDGVELMAKPLREAREIFEREYLLSQVNRFGGNISKTATFVGMERSALHRKLKSLGLQSNDKDRPDDLPERVEA